MAQKIDGSEERRTIRGLTQKIDGQENRWLRRATIQNRDGPENIRVRSVITQKNLRPRMHKNSEHKKGSLSQIRIAAAEDAEAMRYIAQNAFQHYVERMGKQPAPMLANFDFHLKFDTCLLAELDGKAVGYAIIQYGEDEPLLDTVAVLPAFHGQGVGKDLMLAIEAAVSDAGYNSFKLYTNIHMTETIAWYLRGGFETLYQIHEDGFERVYLRKIIA